MTTLERFQQVAASYPRLKIALIGDFCLDRYLEIDPTRSETSIETGLEVYNITRVRSHPGGAGTILNNLVALGVGHIFCVGFCGEDGEGFELRRALAQLRGVDLSHFVTTSQRQTFTYTKPLVITPGKAPRELNRLDIKNWSETPVQIAEQLAKSATALFQQVDAVILLDQVDIANTGVVTSTLLDALAPLAAADPSKLVIADSRRSLKDFPAVCLKMNRAELALLSNLPSSVTVPEAAAQAKALAGKGGRNVFVTLSEHGIIAAAPSGQVVHAPALPTRGEIDIVGAGDSVTANLTAALAAGATLSEALTIAMSASSIVIHQLGCTGTATPAQIADILPFAASPQPPG